MGSLGEHLIGVLRVAAMTAKTSRMNDSGTRAWNRSLIEFTNATRGERQVYGSDSASGWIVSPNPGPDVRGSPSAWYFSLPIALSRFDSVSA